MKKPFEKYYLYDKDEVFNNHANLKIGQNLFHVLEDVCDFTALETDMQEIVKAVEKDNEKIKLDDYERLEETMKRLAIKVSSENDKHSLMRDCCTIIDVLLILYDNLSNTQER